MILGIVGIGGFALLRQDIALALVHFIVGGHIPFTNITLSPLTMLLFWLLILPTIYLFRSSISALFWRAIDTIGTISQRQINRRLRLTQLHRRTVHLVAITLLLIAEQLPEDTLELPELSLRRRFLALQPSS